VPNDMLKPVPMPEGIDLNTTSRCTVALLYNKRGRPIEPMRIL